MFHEYEIVFIIRPDIDDPEVTAAVERVEGTIGDTGGHLLERDDWGKRKLAYPIQKHTKGHYVLLRVASDPASILEIERKMRLDDRIIRFLSVKQDEDVDVELLLRLAGERKAAKEAAAKEAAEAAEAAEAKDKSDLAAASAD